MFDEEIKEALENLPVRLKAARQSRGFDSRYAFAAACGVGLTTYLNHEKGEHLRLSAVMIYCKVLDVSTDWLVWGNGHPLGSLLPDDKNKAFLKRLDTFLGTSYSQESKQLKERKKPNGARATTTS